MRLAEKVFDLLDRLGRVGEKPRHLQRLLEMPLGVAFEPPPGLRESHVLAHTGQHILQGAILGKSVKRIVLRQQSDALFTPDVPQPQKTAAVGSAARHIGAKPDPA